MPELPEVETTRRGISAHVVGRRVVEVIVREPRLRWPVPRAIAREWPGQTIRRVSRRAKYLLLENAGATAILHLGMSGSLSLVQPNTPAGKHDHVDVVLDGPRLLRFNDPRRFGALLWTRESPLEHPLLSGLGPEPLGPDFSGDWLYRLARGRRAAVKHFIMDARVVVGVGNIYASEALYRARISPVRAAGRISLARYRDLAQAVADVLSEAIEAGGTTLRDFVDGEGRPGYFRHHLQVYGRAGEPCPQCGVPIRRRVIGQRASFHCPRCQR